MRPNVKQFVQLLTASLDVPRPIVDIGALRTEGQEGYADLRPFFDDGRGYTGWDMRPGPGVDALGSVHHLPLAPGSAGTILMLDTLEHVLDPIASMREVCAAVRPGGIVMITSHMNFPIHAHPSDYWRFTPMVFDHLLRPLGASHAEGGTRTVFTQGDSENPHNVIGVGVKAGGPAGAEASVIAALLSVQDRWPEDAVGGPLLQYRPLAVDISQRIEDGDSPEIITGVRIEQRFVCRSNGLARIDVKMRNPVHAILRHVVFRLLDDTGAEIAAQRVQGFHVPHDGWFALPMPEQAASAGRSYTLVIESADGVTGQAVFARITNHPVETEGTLTIGGVAAPGALCFQTYRSAPEFAPGDVQIGEQILSREIASPAVGAAPSADSERALSALAQQQSESLRHLTSAIGAGFDALRQQAHDQHLEAMALQERTLNATAEKLLARTVRENPAMRALRRFRKT